MLIQGFSHENNAPAAHNRIQHVTVHQTKSLATRTISAFSGARFGKPSKNSKLRNGGHLAGVIVWQGVPECPLLSTPCVAHSINTCPSGPSKLNRSPYKASHGLMHGTLANIMPSVATASPAHTSTKHCPVTGTSMVKHFSASSKCANTAGSWKPATAFSARVSSRARIPWPPSQYLFLFRGCRSSWPPLSP